MIGRKSAAALACCLVGGCVFFGESPTGPSGGRVKDWNGLDPYSAAEVLDMGGFLAALVDAERRHWTEHKMYSWTDETRSGGSTDDPHNEIGLRIRGKVEWFRLPPGTTLVWTRNTGYNTYNVADAEGVAECFVYVGDRFGDAADPDESDAEWRAQFVGWSIHPERQGEIVCGPQRPSWQRMREAVKACRDRGVTPPCRPSQREAGGS